MAIVFGRYRKRGFFLCRGGIGLWPVNVSLLTASSRHNHAAGSNHDQQPDP